MSSEPVNRRIAMRRHGIQNIGLIWLDANDCNHSISQLRRFVHTFNIFTDVDQCVDFLTEIKEQKVLMIISDDFGQYLVDLIHNVPQLNSIYIFCKSNSTYEQWMQKWFKVKGIFTQIDQIFKSLTLTARQYDQDAPSLSFISTSNLRDQNLDQLDQSFMYTQLLKKS
jgi:hypothetical protein